MISFWGAPRLLVTLPVDEARAVFDLAEAADAIVFWQPGYHRDGTPGAWLPLMLPRSVFQRSGGES